MLVVFYMIKIKISDYQKVALPSASILDRSGSRYLLLNLYGFIDGVYRWYLYQAGFIWNYNFNEN